MDHQNEVAIFVPYPLAAAAGNAVTARRLKGQLEEGGWRVKLFGPDRSVNGGRVLVALNAWRSAEVVQSFEGAVIVILTGTDINAAELADPTWVGRKVMERADSLVVLQNEALKRVPESLQEKVTVIRPATVMPEELRDLSGHGEVLEVVLAGRDRVEKRADIVLEACRSLPEGAGIRVRWFGAEREDPPPGFQWMGEVQQEKLWQEMAEADLFLNASSQEGGANAVVEAMALGLPVLASRIGGNIGLLGEDYPGYFSEGSVEELQEKLLLLRDERVRRKLKDSVRNSRRLFDAEREGREWRALLARVLGEVVP